MPVARPRLTNGMNAMVDMCQLLDLRSGERVEGDDSSCLISESVYARGEARYWGKPEGLPEPPKTRIRSSATVRAGLARRAAARCDVGDEAADRAAAEVGEPDVAVGAGGDAGAGGVRVSGQAELG